MAKISSYLFFCFACLIGSALGDDRPIIPPNVKYKFIDNELDVSLRAELVARFASGEAGVAGIFQGACVCGPGYCRDLSAHGENAIKHPIVTQFSILNSKTGVNYKLDGATIRDAKDIANLARDFSRSIGLRPIIRRLTTEEIELFWIVIPFDIEEPVYAIVNGKSCYVLCLTKNSNSSAYHATWIDELTAYNYTASKGKGPAGAANGSTPDSSNVSPGGG